MSGKSVNSALLLLVLGNFLAILSDIFIKGMEPGAPIFQFAFIRVSITVAVLVPFIAWRGHGGQLRRGLGIHAVRAHTHLVGMVCMVIALTNLPLATANAVFYAAPVLVLLLVWLIYREQLNALSVFAVIGGFVGIVLILRPVEFNLAALAALGSALTLAINAVTVRHLPRGQSTVQKLFLNYLLILPAAAVLALIEGVRFDPDIVIAALASAVLILGYNATVLLAYQTVAASQVTSAEYTGLIWAVLLGWLLFAETPDLWFWSGSLLIVVPLILLGLRREKRTPEVRFSQQQETRYTG